MRKVHRATDVGPPARLQARSTKPCRHTAGLIVVRWTMRSSRRCQMRIVRECRSPIVTRRSRAHSAGDVVSKRGGAKAIGHGRSQSARPDTIGPNETDDDAPRSSKQGTVRAIRQPDRRIMPVDPEPRPGPNRTTARTAAELHCHDQCRCWTASTKRLNTSSCSQATEWPASSITITAHS